MASIGAPRILSHLIRHLVPSRGPATVGFPAAATAAGRKFSLCSVLQGSGGRAETTSTTQGLNKLQAQELVLRLTGEERVLLISALQEYQSKIIKDEYEGF